MIRVIDRFQNTLIQKVTKPNGELVTYQTVPEGQYDSDQVKRYATLQAARESIKGGNNAPAK